MSLFPVISDPTLFATDSSAINLVTSLLAGNGGAPDEVPVDSALPAVPQAGTDDPAASDFGQVLQQLVAGTLQTPPIRPVAAVGSEAPDEQSADAKQLLSVDAEVNPEARNPGVVQAGSPDVFPEVTTSETADTPALPIDQKTPGAGLLPSGATTVLSGETESTLVRVSDQKPEEAHAVPVDSESTDGIRSRLAPRSIPQHLSESSHRSASRSPSVVTSVASVVEEQTAADIVILSQSGRNETQDAVSSPGGVSRPINVREDRFVHAPASQQPLTSSGQSTLTPPGFRHDTTGAAPAVEPSSSVRLTDSPATQGQDTSASSNQLTTGIVGARQHDPVQFRNGAGELEQTQSSPRRITGDNEKTSVGLQQEAASARNSSPVRTVPAESVSLQLKTAVEQVARWNHNGQRSSSRPIVDLPRNDSKTQSPSAPAIATAEHGLPGHGETAGLPTVDSSNERPASPLPILLWKPIPKPAAWHPAAPTPPGSPADPTSASTTPVSSSIGAAASESVSTVTSDQVPNDLAATRIALGIGLAGTPPVQADSTAELKSTDAAGASVSKPAASSIPVNVATAAGSDSSGQLNPPPQNGSPSPVQTFSETPSSVSVPSPGQAANPQPDVPHQPTLSSNAGNTPADERPADGALTPVASGKSHSEQTPSTGSAVHTVEAAPSGAEPPTANEVHFDQPAAKPVPVSTPIAAGSGSPLESGRTEQVVNQSLASEQVESSGVDRQLGDAIRTHVRSVRPDEETRLQVALDPPELGRVVVDVLRTDEGIRARLVAVDSSARALIEAELGQLRQTLGSSGIELIELEVAQDDGTSSDLSQHERNESNARKGHRTEGDDTGRRTVEQPLEEEQPRSSSSRLDVVV